ncbi:unnamed protein product [Brassica oleracea]
MGSLLCSSYVMLAKTVFIVEWIVGCQCVEAWCLVSTQVPACVQRRRHPNAARAPWSSRHIYLLFFGGTEKLYSCFCLHHSSITPQGLPRLQIGFQKSILAVRP